MAGKYPLTWFLAFLAWVPLAAEATVAVRLSTKELAERSQVVVEGKVRSTESRFSEDGRQIVTSVRVKVEDPWKGAPAKEITINVPGGTAEGISQKVQGMPSFREGEEVVVFLDRPSDAAPFQVVGLSQGKFTVLKDPAVGKVVVPDLEGLELVDKDTRTKVQPMIQAPIPLESLKRDVLAAEGK